MKKIIFIVILYGLLISNCSSHNTWVNFRNASFSTVIDSVNMFPNPISGRVHAILVGDEWYKLSSSYYGTFIRFVEKGDSIYKKSGRWDIYVYKKNNGEYTEKYFKGAQGYWD